MAKRSMGKRIHREPTAEQAAKYRKIRELIAAEIPEIKEEARAIRQGRRAKIEDVIGLLRSERQRRGLTLSEISEKTGISKSAISKLESGDNSNPTVRTLTRYAEALGMALTVVVTKDK